MDLDGEPLADDGLPLIEVKIGVVLYLADPPSISVVEAVFEKYFSRFGSRIKFFKSTAPGNFSQDWTPQSAAYFRRHHLPSLYSRMDWGYIFSDGRQQGSCLFMFHGSRPTSEPGKVSFFRFDFDENIEPDLLLEFCRELLVVVPLLSGSAGYYFQTRSNPKYKSQSYDAAFRLAHRYQGVEVQNIDITARHIGSGMKCVNWMTFLGKALVGSYQETIKNACSSAFACFESNLGTLIQATPIPLIGDRDRNEEMKAYTAVAKALTGLQMPEHSPFGGTLWTKENTLEYIQRFSSTLGNSSWNPA